jgi:hypothetical protein
MVPLPRGRLRLSLLALGLLSAAAMACGGENLGPPAGPSDTPRPSSGLTVDAIAVGDIGWCGSRGTHETAQLVNSLSGLLLLAGDIAYPTGSASDFQRCFEPQWGQFRSRWHPVPGNHEYMTANANPYFEYFGQAAGPDRSGYYVRSFGDWLVLMLDSNSPSQRNSPQWEFVRRELELQHRPCTLAVWHHPLFTSGQNGPNAQMRDLFGLLEAGGADVVINAHDHLYERFASQTADGRPSERGVRQFIVGTGGADLYRFVTTAPNSEARIAQFGILRLSLQPTAYRWEFVLTAGGLADSGNDVCH